MAAQTDTALLDVVRLALSEECQIDPARVELHNHILDDLDIDSLDLLNAAFRLEKETGIRNSYAGVAGDRIWR